jgi:pyrimidine deaminase RibD-like protein
LLENADIYVGSTPCAKIGSSPPSNEYLTITCEKEIRNVFAKEFDPNEAPFVGIEGDFIEIKSSSPGILSICDV